MGERKGLLMAKDTYMNWFTMDVESTANPTTLVNANFNTGAGVGTQLAWRIHIIQWYSNGVWTGASDGSTINFGLSTRKDLTAMPELTDKGTISRHRQMMTVYSSASTVHTKWPFQERYLPPMLVASPNFSIYFQSTVNFAGQQSKEQMCRIGFTTEKLTESAYREVFETWNYAN